MPFVLQKNVGKALISVENLRQLQNQSRQHKRSVFEGTLQIRGAYFHAFQTNGQIGHTCVGPQKLRWPRAPRSQNSSLSSGILRVSLLKIFMQFANALQPSVCDIKCNTQPETYARGRDFGVKTPPLV